MFLTLSPPFPKETSIAMEKKSHITWIWSHLQIHKRDLRSSEVQQHLGIANLSWDGARQTLDEEVVWAGWSREERRVLCGFRSRKCVVFLALYSLTFWFETKFLDAGSYPHQRVKNPLLQLLLQAFCSIIVGRGLPAWSHCLCHRVCSRAPDSPFSGWCESLLGSSVLFNALFVRWFLIFPHGSWMFSSISWFPLHILIVDNLNHKLSWFVFKHAWRKDSKKMTFPVLLGLLGWWQSLRLQSVPHGLVGHAQEGTFSSEICFGII